MTEKDVIWESESPIPIFSRRSCSIFVAILAALSFIISLDGDFVFDDSEAVINNRDIRLSTPVHQIFQNDFWGTNMLNNRSHKSYRPVTVMTFKLNLLLSNGEITPFKFKLTNLILHIITALLCVRVYEQLLGGSGCYPRTVFLSSLLFAVHPIHTEAVANVVGRAELLSTIFGLAGFLTYCKASNAQLFVSNVLWSLISIVFIGLSMFSKEQGITIISVCILYDLIIVNKIEVSSSLEGFARNMQTKVLGLKFEESVQRKRQSSDRCSSLNNKVLLNSFLFVRVVLMIACGMGLLYLRLRIMGSLPSFQKADNPAAFIENRPMRILNHFYVYSLNVWLLFCPEWLCFDWSMGCVPLITSFRDLRVVGILAFIVIFLCISLSVINFEKNKIKRASFMALSIILLTFLPASNLFFKVGFVVAERVLYLPSIGYCLMVSIGIQKLSGSVSTNTQFMVLRISVWLLIIVFFARSVRRSVDWRTEKDLFRSALGICPLNAKVHYNMGKVANNRNMAIKHYRDAITLNPEYDQAMNNLANILKDDGLLDEAEHLLRKAVKLRTDSAAAWMNLGIVLSNKKQHEEAEKSFLNALKHRKHYPDCYYNLGNLYLDKKMYTEAYNAWHKAISQNPKQIVAWNNIIIMLDSIGEYGKAVQSANDALKLLPDDPGLHFNLANALGKLSRFEEAEEHFQEAIRFKPDQSLYYVNLGVLYHRWKKYEKAKLMYQTALKLNPTSESAIRNLKML